MMKQTTLVLGGSGKTGRRVAERLKRLDWPLRTGSRSSSPAFDWSDPSTWKAALLGVRSVYMSYYPDLAAPGAAAAIEAFTELAKESGVVRVVLLSGRGEPEAQRCEQIVRSSGLEWTLVRASWFNQNFSEGYLLEPILGGEIVLPAGPVGEPFVDADDIADVAVAALTDDRHRGQLYEVTGPRSLSFADAIIEIGRATGRNLRYVQVSNEEYTAALAQAAIPPEFVQLVSYLFGEVLDGRNSSTADGVMRALGRPPKDFRVFASQAAATGVWNAPA